MKRVILAIALACAVSNASAEVVEHPDGCPRRLFCGCGAAKYLGLSDRSLWLAREWLRFPASEPVRGAVAVWRHHVAVILEYLGQGKAKLYDANSGGHLTRIHIRSIAGASIRNPSGSSSASPVRIANAHAARPSKKRHHTGRVLASVSSPNVPLLHRPL